MAARRRYTMMSLKSTTQAIAALGAAAALLGACGEGDTEAPASAPKLAPASAVEANPYAITCGHVRNQQRWASLTRRTTVAIADRERFRNLTPLLASQSVYYALTEVCKQKPATFEPAQAAAEGVRHGTFRVGRPDHSVE
jgi:uncharacterized lipoprotein YajG